MATPARIRTFFANICNDTIARSPLDDYLAGSFENRELAVQSLAAPPSDEDRGRAWVINAAYRYTLVISFDDDGQPRFLQATNLLPEVRAYARAQGTATGRSSRDKNRLE